MNPSLLGKPSFMIIHWHKNNAVGGGGLPPFPPQVTWDQILIHLVIFLQQILYSHTSSKIMVLMVKLFLSWIYLAPLCICHLILEHHIHVSITLSLVHTKAIYIYIYIHRRPCVYLPFPSSIKLLHFFLPIGPFVKQSKSRRMIFYTCMLWLFSRGETKKLHAMWHKIKHILVKQTMIFQTFILRYSW